LDIKGHEDENGKKLEADPYKIWSGKQAMIRLDKNISLYGNNDFAKNIAEQLKNERNTRVQIAGDEIKIKVRKNKCHHRSHISSYILDYSRTQILEQLYKIPYERARRIQLDGIYFENTNVEVVSTFQYKPVIYRKNETCERYVSNYNHREWNPPKYDEQFTHKHILATGQGGSGKTTFYLRSRHLINPVFCAPTNKLLRNKVEDEKLTNVCSWAKILREKIVNGENEYVCREHEGDKNIIIMDEVSMLTECRYQKMLEMYPNSMIIFCGDPGYQLPPQKRNGDRIVTGKLHPLL
jgi:hypothetical protein